jgi:hypothetical protein
MKRETSVWLSCDVHAKACAVGIFVSDGENRSEFCVEFVNDLDRRSIDAKIVDPDSDNEFRIIVNVDAEIERGYAET